jgi:hypothetical protein
LDWALRFRDGRVDTIQQIGDLAIEGVATVALGKTATKHSVSLLGDVIVPVADEICVVQLSCGFGLRSELGVVGGPVVPVGERVGDPVDGAISGLRSLEPRERCAQGRDQGAAICQYFYHGVCTWFYSRVELAANVSRIQSYASRNSLVARVQIKDTVFCLANPDNLGHLRSKRCLGGVATLHIEEVPSGRGLGCRPIVAGRREQGSILASQRESIVVK